MTVLQCTQNDGQAIIFLHLHFVFAALVNDITKSSGGDVLHLLIVTVEEQQELSNPAEIVHLETGGGC